ncbi:MAG: hypothetical protein HY782_20725 [Chloroflexi bacterium]|nr:hypothetical protein [Chloroflexota bacterium]
MTSTQRAALVLFIIALVIYTFPLVYNALVTPFFNPVPSQDVVSASLAPVSLLTRGNFYLDQYRRFVANNYSEPNFVAEVNGHMVARTTVVSGVLALPFMGAGLGTGWLARTANVFDIAKLAAAVLTALAVLAFFFAARELTDTATSILVAVAFAFGSSVWATASQGLWQHTPSVLFQSIALWFLARGLRRGARAVIPAGLFLSLATIARPPVAVTAFVLTLFVLRHFRAALIPFGLAALPPLALALIYNAAVNGSPFVFGYQDQVSFGFPQWEAFQGLLFSPSRGLFVFSPFLLLAPIGLWFGWLRERQHLYAYLAIAFIAYLTIMAAWGSLGGWAYGSRMLTDTLPVMCLLIIPAVERIRGRGRAALWVVVLFAAFAQMLGLWDYGVRFHAAGNSVWSIENNEPWFYLKLYIEMAQAFFAS